MRQGEFKINGVNSRALGTFIQGRPIIKSPIRHRDDKEVFGITGTLPIEGKSYKNSDMELILFTDALDDSLTMSDYREHAFAMFDKEGYMEVEFYFDPGKIWLVMLKDQPVEFENKFYYGDSMAWKVQLTVHPWKYFMDSEPATITSKNTVVTNPHITESAPLITIEGSGDIDLTVGSHEFRMKGVKSAVGIILDSEISKAYHKTTGGKLNNENDKTYTREYPLLYPGDNNITWTGNVDKIIIEPRWRSKV